MTMASASLSSSAAGASGASSVAGAETFFSLSFFFFFFAAAAFSAVASSGLPDVLSGSAEDPHCDAGPTNQYLPIVIWRSKTPLEESRECFWAAAEQAEYNLVEYLWKDGCNTLFSHSRETMITCCLCLLISLGLGSFNA